MSTATLPTSLKAQLLGVPAPKARTRTMVTRLMWDMAPKGDKKKHKDGTKLMRFKLPGKGRTEWREVYWVN